MTATSGCNAWSRLKTGSTVFSTNLPHVWIPLQVSSSKTSQQVRRLVVESWSSRSRAAGAWAFATSTSMDPSPGSTGLTGFGGQVCDGGLHGDYGEDCCCSCWFCSCLLLRHLSTVLRCCLRSCALSCRWPFPFPSPDHRTVLRFRSVDHGIADCRTHDSLLY